MDLCLLDLDGGVTTQPALRKQQPTTVPLHDWAPRLRLACSFGAFRRFEQHLGELLGSPDDEPRLTFYGSGDFHHVSLALLRRIQRPFNLVVLDNHPDWMRGVPLMHCGTWLRHAAQLPNVGKIFHLGGDVDFDNYFRPFAPWHDLRSGKIVVLPAYRSLRGRAWANVPHQALRTERVQTLTSERVQELLAPHAEELASKPLYISLDKDVMQASDSAVNWDSGHLTLGEVRSLLVGLVRGAENRLAGMDVLGDWSPVQVRGIMRRYLHLTEHPRLRLAPHDALTINDRTNQVLLDTLTGLGVYRGCVSSRRAAS